MKSPKAAIYLRYEFSDESGKPEGGDIFRFTSLREVHDMVGQILKVAHSDGVTVNITTGEEAPFYGFLKRVGMSRADADSELVDRARAPIGKKGTPKKAAPNKKTTRKTAASRKKP